MKMSYLLMMMMMVVIVLFIAQSVAGFRVELTHRDSLQPPSFNRLKTAVDRSLSRMHAFAQTITPAASTAPVYSSDNGAYLINLSLGTPPQNFSAILDTGSDLVWRQADPCIECYNQTGPVFEPSNSSTYAEVPCSDPFCTDLPYPECTGPSCDYTYSYGDGSTTQGVLSYDTLTIGGVSAKKFAFGAGNQNTGNIGTLGVAGLVGMGGGELSLPSQMASTISSKFSYCLVTWTDAPSKTSPLLFGSSANISGSGVQSTPFVSGSEVSVPTFYYLTVKGISVNGKLLDIPSGTFDIQPDGSGGVVIDSGTTVTILNGPAYTPLRAAYASAIHLPPVDGSSVGLDLCYDSSKASNITIPSLTFHFDGADASLPPGNIFMDYQGLFCLAAIGAPPQININIYGNVQQQNFQFVYDKGPSNQLSFKPVTCETL